jgi:hypothetical protein
MLKPVILSAAKDLTTPDRRSFAALRMTFDDQSREVVVLQGRLKFTPMELAPIWLLHMCAVMLK